MRIPGVRTAHKRKACLTPLLSLSLTWLEPGGERKLRCRAVPCCAVLANTTASKPDDTRRTRPSVRLALYDMLVSNPPPPPILATGWRQSNTPRCYSRWWHTYCNLFARQRCRTYVRRLQRCHLSSNQLETGSQSISQEFHDAHFACSL